MRHVFTTREKVLLVILAVLVIAVGYWKLILTPINDSIADLNAQTASEIPERNCIPEEAVTIRSHLI